MTFLTKLLNRSLILWGIIFLISSGVLGQDTDYQEQLKEYELKKKAIEDENRKKMAEAEQQKQETVVKQAVNDGNTYIRKKQWEKALQSYDLAIKYNSNFAKAYYGKGLALRQLNKYNEALKAYQKATQIDPLYSQAYLAMGILYRLLKQYDYALTACLSAIQTDLSLIHISEPTRPY